MSKKSALPAVLAATVALASGLPEGVASPVEPEPEKPPEEKPAPAKPRQAPSVGRVVHFHFEREGELVTRPAMIVRTWDPEEHPAYQSDEVNLRVFLDGCNDGEGTDGPRDHQTSVPRSDEPKAGSWSWPPFVPGKAS